MEGLWIVPGGRDPALGEEPRQRLRFLRSDHEEVPDGLAPSGDRREAKVADTRKPISVERCGLPPLVVPALEVRQLLQQDERLDRVEPCRVADQVVLVLARLSMLAQGSDARRKRLVVRRERAGVAYRSQVLSRVEAE